MAQKKRVKQITKKKAIKQLRRIVTELKNLDALIDTSKWGYGLFSYDIIIILDDLIKWIPSMNKAEDYKRRGRKYAKLSEPNKLRKMLGLRIKRIKRSK